MRAVKAARLGAVESTSLADLARSGVLSFGDGYRTMRSELGSSGFPILRVAQVADGFIRPTSSPEYVREEFRRAIGPKLSQTDDVVLTTKGTFGRRAYVRPEDADYVYSPQVCWFRIVDRARIDPRYLYFWLGSSDFTNQAHGMKSQTDMADYLSLGDLARINVPLPPLPQQRAIAHILGTLDDKIELNRRTNETLEAIARALFKSWFVDFDPVRAKSKGRDPGLPPHVAELFPDSFEDSELGEIPTGWRVGHLRDALAELVSGARPRGGAVGDGVPSIGAENVIGLGRYDFSSEKFVPPAFFEQLKLKGAAVRHGDVLLYKDGAGIGRKTYFEGDFPHGECAVNEHVFILRARSRKWQRFLFFWLDQDLVTSEIVSLNSNSAQPGINQHGVRGLRVLVPDHGVIGAFDQLVAPLFGRLFANCQESRTLAASRDVLLPRFISGESWLGSVA